MQDNDDSDQGFYPQDYQNFVDPQEPPTGTPGMTPDQNNIPTNKVPPGHQYTVQMQPTNGLQSFLSGLPWKWIAIAAVGYIVLKKL